jgi:hypothetical protein
LASKYKFNKDVSEEFPLFNDDESDMELDRWRKEWAKNQDECKKTLKTIRILENIILNNFNSKHEVYPLHFLDQYISYYWDDDEDSDDDDDSYFDDDNSNNEED